MTVLARLVALPILLVAAVAVAQPARRRPEPAPPDPGAARAFVAKVNAELDRLERYMNRVAWIQATYINHDTERLLAQIREEAMAYRSQAIRESARFRGGKLDPATARAIRLLLTSQSLPASSDPARRAELTELATRLESIYSRGKWCGAGGKRCRTLDQLSEVMARSRRYDELLDAWVGWRTIAREMRPLYRRNVELANQAARELGFGDLGELWRSRYDMAPADFEREADRLWGQVKPLYDDLHCYVRGRLSKRYGADKVPPTGPIPAHLLGNMWAQDWSNVYDLVQPYRGGPALDVDRALVAQRWDAVKMARTAEAFFTSIGLRPLPETFWTRSLLARPRDREVDCHPSAWEVESSEDVRIKMCIKVNAEDLRVLHHELGHNYYFLYYKDLPNLFRGSAHDGFHEAIGDSLVLSMTPGYLHKLGLLKSVPRDRRGLINVQMKRALSDVAFLPFGRLIDQWRWSVFAGTIKPEAYNQGWWDLRGRYQGVAPPVARSEDDFDPGAKFHIPANYPYTAYFLAHILQYQLHQAMCRAAGQTGPLHECSIYGSKEAGAKLRALLELGASKPWPDALEAMTGQRTMDASALLAYYEPLHAWLKEQNRGQTCGW